jgi:hypothetical protein
MRFFLALMALAACPSGDDGRNPPRVWLATNGSELRVKLQPIEPNPF